MSETDLAIRVILLPKDTNMHGTIFGGAILSHIDLAAAVEVRKHTIHPHVTVALDEVVFKRPVYVGDIVSFYTCLMKMGTSSIQVHVKVVAERYKQPGTLVDVTAAMVTFVTVDSEGRRIPHDAPGAVSADREW